MSSNVPSVAIITGEASGDLHGACLAASLKDIYPGIDISGVGGRRMREAGVRLLHDSSSWSAIGIAEALKLVPALLRAQGKLKKQLGSCPPDLVVLVDFGAFNLRLGTYLHARGVPVMYYFPPGSWKRSADYSRLRDVADRVVTPFPWSAESLSNQGFSADFFGHPLLDVVQPGMARDEFCRRFEFDPDRPIIGLLPGSRNQELLHILPALLISAARLIQTSPDLQFAVPLASSLNADAIERELARVPWIQSQSYCPRAHSNFDKVSRLPLSSVIAEQSREDRFTAPPSKVHVKLLPGMAYDVLAHSRAAIVSSGTATVEAAILGCPMVIVYRGSRMMTFEYRLLGRNIKYIGMPNIMLDRMLCPELRAEDANPTRIYGEISALIPDSNERSEMIHGLDEVRRLLGTPGAVRKTAMAVLDMLGVNLPAVGA